MEISVSSEVKDYVFESLNSDLKVQWVLFSEEDMMLLGYFIIRSKQIEMTPSLKTVHSEGDFSCVCSMCLHPKLEKLNVSPKKVELWRFLESVDNRITREICDIVNKLKRITLPALPAFDQFIVEGSVSKIASSLPAKMRSQFLLISDDGKAICAYFIMRGRLLITGSVPGLHDDAALPCICSSCFRTYTQKLNVCAEKFEIWYLLQAINCKITAEVGALKDQLNFTLPPPSIAEQCVDLVIASIRGSFDGGRRSVYVARRRGATMNLNFLLLVPIVILAGFLGGISGFGSALLDSFLDVAGGVSREFKRGCVKFVLFPCLILMFLYLFFFRRGRSVFVTL